MSAGKQFFVGPDNGVFSYIYDREPKYRTYHATKEQYFRQPTSTTFHGRDIFAPVAAALSTGVKPQAFGSSITDPVRLENSLMPLVQRNGRVEGRIIHIDRFGNCVTNLTAEHLRGDSTDAELKLIIKETLISSVRQFFSEKSASDGELFMLLGSAGFIEIAARNASPASILSVRRGQSIRLLTNSQPDPIALP